MTSVAAIAQDQDFQGASPSATDKVPAATLDSQFQVTKAKLNELINALAIAIRDDNTLVDELVRLRNLHPEVTSAIASKSGWQPKAAVAVATTANIVLTGEQTIDGILTSGSRVLVKNQTTTSQNGLYVSAAGVWSRATDTDTIAELGYAFVYVNGGLLNGASTWVLSQAVADIVAIGTTSLTWAQVGGAGGILPILKGGTGAVDAPTARTNLGSTTVGDSIFTAVSSFVARVALGATTIGHAIFTAASTAAALATLNAVGREAKIINVVQDLGVDNTGVSDCKTAIQAAITAADLHGITLFFPQGYYLFTTGLDLQDKPITFVGSGFRTVSTATLGSSQYTQANKPIYGTVIFSAQTSGIFIDATTHPTGYTQKLNMRDIAIVGSGNGTTTGISIGLASILAATFCKWDNVAIANFGIGLLAGIVYQSEFRSLSIIGCTTGLQLGGGAGLGSNACIFPNLNITSCTTGCTIDGSEEIIITGGALQGIGTNGIVIGGSQLSQSIRIENIYFESAAISGKDLIITNAYNSGLIGCHFGDSVNGGVTVTAGNGNYFIANRDATSGTWTIGASANYTMVLNNTILNFTDLGTYTYLCNHQGMSFLQSLTTWGGIICNGGVAGSGLAGQSIDFATSAPASGVWQRGSIRFNSLQAVGAPTGWRCTVSGTPGTWVAMANL